jgi:hypothetical protein
MEQNEFKLNLRDLCETKRNKASGKTEVALKHQLIDMSGNGKTVYYLIDRNEYFKGDKQPAVQGEELLEFLKDVRWPFSKVDKGIDSFPPTPENIDFKRKELFSQMSTTGAMSDPAAIAKLYTSIAPTHIEANAVFKKLGSEYEHSEQRTLERLTRR